MEASISTSYHIRYKRELIYCSIGSTKQCAFNKRRGGKAQIRNDRITYKPFKRCLAAVVAFAEQQKSSRARLSADLSNLALVDSDGLSLPVYFSLQRAKVGNPTLPYLSLPFCAPHTKSGWHVVTVQFTSRLSTLFSFFFVS